MRKPLGLCYGQIIAHNRVSKVGARARGTDWQSSKKNLPLQIHRNTVLYYLIIITASHLKQMKIQLLLRNKKKLLQETSSRINQTKRARTNVQNYILAHYCVLSWVSKILTTRPNVHKFNFLFKKKKILYKKMELIKSQLNYAQCIWWCVLFCMLNNIHTQYNPFPIQIQTQYTHNLKLKIKERQFAGYTHLTEKTKTTTTHKL